MSSKPIQAAVVTAAKRIEIVELERRPLQPGQVRLAVRQCGICAFDVRLWRTGPRGPRPVPLGHEFAGTVIEAGPGTSRLAVGQRVAAWDDGGLATEAVVNESHCFPVDEGVRFPFAVEPLSCVINSVWMSNPARGANLAVVGGGFNALLAVQFIRRTLAPERLIVASSQDDKDVLAQRLGATHTIRPIDLPLLVHAETTGRGADIVYDFTGVQPGLDLAAAAAGRGGKLVLAGFHQIEQHALDLAPARDKGVRIVEPGFPNERAILDRMGSAAAILRGGLIDPAPLIRQVYSPVVCSGSAFADAAAGLGKLVIRP